MNMESRKLAQNNQIKDKPSPIRTKLYVSNFPENCTRRHLTEFFSKFGQVLECAIMWDTYAFIHYGSMEEAQTALKGAQRMNFMGKKLYIQLSTSRNRQSCNWYQQEAAKLLQKDQHQNLNDDSILSNDESSSNCSANFVETKLYVTNLPEQCEQRELKALFEKYGEVLECVIMWNHYAFVHFSNLAHAKYALKNLHGYLFNGKNIIVQLSTSSNRPLPKCLAFVQNKNNISSQNATINNSVSKMNNSLNKNCDKKPVNGACEEDIYGEQNAPSSIICYRACDSNADQRNSYSKENTSSGKNWIQALSNGSVPIISPSHKSSDRFDINKLFTNISSSTKNIKNLSLNEIPTPKTPDHVILNNKFINTNNKNNNKQNSNLNSTVLLNQVPNPPVPPIQKLLESNLSNNDVLIKKENETLKKLIDSINGSYSGSNNVKLNNKIKNSCSSSLFDTKIVEENEEDELGVNNHEDDDEETDEIFEMDNLISEENYQSENDLNFDDEEKNDVQSYISINQDEKQHEQVLIERLKMLNYESSSSSKTTTTFSSIESNSESLLKNLWNQCDQKSTTSNSYHYTNNLQARSLSSASSGIYSRSPSPASLLAQQLESLLSNAYTKTTTTTKNTTIDFLNKNCKFRENLIKSSENNEWCANMNYLLFPEIKEDNFHYRQDYERTLIEMIKKATTNITF